MRRKLIAGLAAAALLLTIAATVRADEVKQIVVLPFTVAEGLNPKTGALLDEVVLTELEPVVPKGIKVVGSADVTALLGYEQKKMLVGCEETGCLVEIGSALGATHILVPGVGKLGSRYLVSAKFLDVKSGEVLLRKVFYVDANEDALLKGVRQISLALAEAQGWKAQAASPGVQPLATAIPSTTAATSADPSATVGSSDTLLWAGVGTAAVGALLAAGLGIGAVVVDATVVGDAAGDPTERADAAGTAMLLGAGSGVGALILVAGAALIGVSAL